MGDQTQDSTLPEILKRADNLPSLPAVAVEVLRLTRNGDAGVAELSDVLTSDPSLSAKLLRLSNSTMFNPGAAEVLNVREAAMRLGLDRVKLLALSFSLVSIMPKGEGSNGFERRCWKGLAGVAPTS